MRCALRAWCVATILALWVVGPGALVASGDDGPSRAFPADRPTRSVLRPTEIPELGAAATPRTSDKTVILLVSGIGSDASDSTFDAIIAVLGKDPRYEVHRFGGSAEHPYDTRGSIDQNADQLIAEVRDLARTHPKVDIVAHSMGGAVVDDAFRRGLSAQDKVETYVALAAPHDGSTEARMSTPFLTISALLGMTPEFRAVTGGLAQDVGSRAARDLAVIKAGPPPPGVTRLDLRMATDVIVTAPDSWTPGVTSRTLLPSRPSSVEGHGGVTTDPHAIAVVTATIAHAQPPVRSWRDTILEQAAGNLSTAIQLVAPILYCGAILVGLGCAFSLWIKRRRSGLAAAFR